MIVPEKIYKLNLTSTEINIYQYLCMGEVYPFDCRSTAQMPICYTEKDVY